MSKFKYFLSIAALGTSIQANAGFISSYALGVPTSISGSSFAGAALSNGSDGSIVQEEKNNLAIEEKWVINGIKFDNLGKQLTPEEHRVMDLLEGVNFFKINLNPGGGVKLPFTWKSSIKGGIDLVDSLSDKELEKNKYQNFTSRLGEEFRIERQDDAIILINQTNEKVTAMAALKRGQDKAIFMAHNFDTIMKKKSDELEKGKTVVLGLVFGVPLTFVMYFLSRLPTIKRGKKEKAKAKSIKP